MSFENLLNASADIKRPEPDYDDMGGVVYTMTTFAASHPVRISQAVPTEVNSGPADWAEATVMIYAMPGTESRRDDEVHPGPKVDKGLGVQ